MAFVDGQRGTQDTVVAGSGFTRQATGVSQSAGSDGNLPSVEESGCRKVKEQIKKLPLEVVKAPKWSVIFPFVKLEDTPRIRKKSRDPCKPKRRRRREE